MAAPGCHRAALVALLAVFAGAAPAQAYLDGPPAGHTGGFGEPTCHRCHFDQPLDDPAGRLDVEGFPEDFEPGRRYELRVTLTRPGTVRGGFQLAVRFGAGERAGRPAGRLTTRAGTEVVEGPAGVPYARQAGGSTPADGSFWWIVEWESPPGSGGEVILHVAANAANGDDSELGDFVYLGERRGREREGGCGGGEDGPN
ncbi:MAG: choice-of-anchor V domain-containing protein [Thermodesulfobacteriota bacterium]